MDLNMCKQVIRSVKIRMEISNYYGNVCEFWSERISAILKIAEETTNFKAICQDIECTEEIILTSHTQATNINP